MKWTAVLVLVLGAGLALWAPASVTAKKPRHLTAEAQSQFGLDMYKVSSNTDNRFTSILFSYKYARKYPLLWRTLYSCCVHVAKSKCKRAVGAAYFRQSEF